MAQYNSNGAYKSNGAIEQTIICNRAPHKKYKTSVTKPRLGPILGRVITSCMHSILYYHEKKYVCACTTGAFSTHFCSIKRRIFKILMQQKRVDKERKFQFHDFSTTLDIFPKFHDFSRPGKCIFKFHDRMNPVGALYINCRTCLICYFNSLYITCRTCLILIYIYIYIYM